MLLSMTTHGAAPAAEVDALKAGVFNPAREAPDFSVRGSDGVALTLSHYRGKVVVLGFGYTSCPNVCPVTLAVLALAHRKLGALGSQVQVIYLTVDPERDSAERLKQYLAAFDPTFVVARAPPHKWQRCAPAMASRPRKSGTRKRLRRCAFVVYLSHHS